MNSESRLDVKHRTLGFEVRDHSLTLGMKPHWDLEFLMNLCD